MSLPLRTDTQRPRAKTTHVMYASSSRPQRSVGNGGIRRRRGWGEPYEGEKGRRSKKRVSCTVPKGRRGKNGKGRGRESHKTTKRGTYRTTSATNAKKGASNAKDGMHIDGYLLFEYSRRPTVGKVESRRAKGDNQQSKAGRRTSKVENKVILRRCWEPKTTSRNHRRAKRSTQRRRYLGWGKGEKGSSTTPAGDPVPGSIQVITLGNCLKLQLKVKGRAGGCAQSGSRILDTRNTKARASHTRSKARGWTVAFYGRCWKSVGECERTDEWPDVGDRSLEPGERGLDLTRRRKGKRERARKGGDSLASPLPKLIQQEATHLNAFLSADTLLPLPSAFFPFHIPSLALNPAHTSNTHSPTRARRFQSEGGGGLNRASEYVIEAGMKEEREMQSGRRRRNSGWRRRGLRGVCFGASLASTICAVWLTRPGYAWMSCPTSIPPDLASIGYSGVPASDRKVTLPLVIAGGRPLNLRARPPKNIFLPRSDGASSALLSPPTALIEPDASPRSALVLALSQYTRQPVILASVHFVRAMPTSLRLNLIRGPGSEDTYFNELLCCVPGHPQDAFQDPLKNWNPVHWHRSYTVRLRESPPRPKGVETANRNGREYSWGPLASPELQRPSLLVRSGEGYSRSSIANPILEYLGNRVSGAVYTLRIDARSELLGSDLLHGLGLGVCVSGSRRIAYLVVIMALGLTQEIYFVRVPVPNDREFSQGTVEVRQMTAVKGGGTFELVGNDRALLKALAGAVKYQKREMLQARQVHPKRQFNRNSMGRLGFRPLPLSRSGQSAKSAKLIREFPDEVIGKESRTVCDARILCGTARPIEIVRTGELSAHTHSVVRFSELCAGDMLSPQPLLADLPQLDTTASVLFATPFYSHLVKQHFHWRLDIYLSLFCLEATLPLITNLFSDPIRVEKVTNNMADSQLMLNSPDNENADERNAYNDLRSAEPRAHAVASPFNPNDPAFTWALLECWEALHDRFEHGGDLNDISEAISIPRIVVERTPEGDVHLAPRLGNLGNSFTSRFEHTGNPTDLAEAISLHTQALNLTPEGHANLPRGLAGLGNSYLRRFERTGDLGDIAESISLQTHSVGLTPEGHTDLPGRLTNLGAPYVSRFERTGNLLDINEAISAQAVEHTPPSHPRLPKTLDSFENSLLCRFDHSGDPGNVMQAIAVLTRAVGLAPEGHALLGDLHRNLGKACLQRFALTSDWQHMAEAIYNLHEATFPKYLTFWELLGAAATMQVVTRVTSMQPFRVIDLQQRAHSVIQQIGFVANFDPGVPTATPFEGRWRRVTRATKANVAVEPSLTAVGRPFTDRGDHRLVISRWGTLLHHHHSQPQEVLTAFGMAMDLLTLIAGLEETVQHRYATIEEYGELPLEAAAIGFILGGHQKALEWLEQGRCLVWGQHSGLRTPLDGLKTHNEGLANRVMEVSRLLEGLGSSRQHSSTGKSLAGKVTLEDEALKHLRLAAEWDRLLEQVRANPGFENFLQPLRCAAILEHLPRSGPVVVLNIHEVRCDAIVLRAGSDELQHVPLLDFTLEKAKLYRRMLRIQLRCHGLRDQGLCQTPEHGRGRAAGPYRSKAGAVLTVNDILKSHWDEVVKPILNVLGFSGRGSGGIADYAVSSYTPTVTALAQRVKNDSPIDERALGLFLTCQPEVPHFGAILGTKGEVREIYKGATEQGVRSLSLEGDTVTPERCLEYMEEYSSIHLACHGFQDISDPLQSRFLFHKGPLPLSSIMQKNLPNADLAYLSACQTSTGRETLANEVVHLAAGMLAAGYRRVVSTMWEIGDKDAPQVAHDFYKYLWRHRPEGSGSRFDGSLSAYALHHATQELRGRYDNTDRSLLAWMPFVHYGY
ncbi:hypothetical protein FA13DRAFT_1774537 [Coprinellus micaceus]|uniref:CHAT domain-containing protein n=1 Tax=Coprinellus micaceus TaxID=71717 RepID=A0A4Y7TCA1_COPMI|nr:hypothetical protein FA13DRAFT_1774537 [Coprinellus micaceus]